MNDSPTATATAAPSTPDAPGFRHELYPYAGDREFLDGALDFIDDAAGSGEAVIIAVGAGKERLLRDRLSGSGSGPAVSFLDVTALGRNPARLIPAWQDHIAKAGSDGRAVRGIGESDWGGPDAALAGELRYHEWLLNRAFAASPAWWLLCPYDRSILEPRLLDAAGRCHPMTYSGGAHQQSADYADSPFLFEPLGAPCDPHQGTEYGPGDLSLVRDRIRGCADEHGLSGRRLTDLLLAATEIATNSIRHGGGSGTLRTWVHDDWLICEFHDAGFIPDPLVGRIRPTAGQAGGHGMWLVQQVCDLVQIRSDAVEGTTVRLHAALPGQTG